MDRKKNRLGKGLTTFRKVEFNFTEMSDLLHSSEPLRSEVEEWEANDEGLEALRMENSYRYEEMIAQILANLAPDEKLVFSYQLLRDSGFNFDHGTLAKCMGIHRRQYMKILDNVRFKVNLFIISWRYDLSDHKSS